MAAHSRSSASGSHGRDPAAAAPAQSARSTWRRRVPWVAVGLTALIALSAGFAVLPIRNAASLQPVPDVRLVRSAAYLLLAPICEVFDTLSLMSVRQHVAILVTLVVLFAGWRAWRGMHRGTRWWREVLAVFIGLAAFIAFYAVGVLVPRPMAALMVDAPFNSVILVADFHSHTSYSHDGMAWFTPEANRQWHARAGYDVAYITDHRTVRGAELGLAGNPSQAGQGTTILQGLEVVWDGAHVNILGAQRTYKGLTDVNLRDIDDTALTLASMIPGREPVVVFTFPGRLADMKPAHGPGTPGVRAIEVVDGAIRGFSDTRRNRAAIVAAADSLHLALVSGSNNHGWGFTAPGWTLLQVPGWRGMDADDLAEAIDADIRTHGFQATQVVERRVAETGGSPWQLAVTVPLVAWRMFTTMSGTERASWIAWIWVLVVLRFTWRRRRTRDGAARA
ncbi:MAG TPA: hypothetical protein VFK16_09960 [Gemmatimonadaceae bacterium]|nr:hypothetical protein [Gemmatimonadaceae bacterium]